MAEGTWKTALVAVVALAAGVVLAGSGLLDSAQAQSEGRTSGVICVVGEQRNGYAPIVLIDVPDQSIMVYEYSYSDDRIELTAARTYRFDKQLADFQTEGPTVDTVRQWVNRR